MLKININYKFSVGCGRNYNLEKNGALSEYLKQM